MRKIAIILLLSLAAGLCAQTWRTHFAYTNVTQIAMGDDCVYAISDGSLFSVNKQTEQMQLYNRLSGLHATGITCIYYDNTSHQLLIGYATGQIDILSKNGTKYIGELYEKDITQQKTIYNFTVHRHTAYISTHFGVQTLDLRENKLVDSYWLRPNGQETPIEDILIANDSIYAFSADSLFTAALADNIVDYTFWNREKRSARISPNPDKGKHYQEGTDHWYAGSAEGIVRYTAISRMGYKPQGPLNNNPNRLFAYQDKLYMLNGGRWASQNGTPGAVMIYDGVRWTNIPYDSISKKTTGPVLDFMNLAVDPNDNAHFYVTSYGTGLYEFRGTNLERKYLAGQEVEVIGAAAPSAEHFTRLDCATYDEQGNLWMLNAGEVPYSLISLDKDGQWHGIQISQNNILFPLHTPGGLLIDKFNPHLKWFCTARYNTALFMMDDNGTPFNTEDDYLLGRSKWQDAGGRECAPAAIYDMIESADGKIILGTNIGLVFIDATTDFLTSDRCTRPVLMDNNGENPMTTMPVKCMCEDAQGRIWAGTETLGVYLLDHEAKEIIAHYTTENSLLPSNAILSLAANDKGAVFIGTGEGLVEYNPAEPTLGVTWADEEDENLSEGAMLHWRLHFSYNSPTQVVATSSRIYAVASGSLFYLDRATGQPEYLSKATGLNGSSVARIAYDEASEQLMIIYEDGRIDLLSSDGNVRQMPDLYMKAGSMAVSVNDVCVGSRFVYLAMPFGIIAINPAKGEVIDTYYIGSEAASVNVEQLVEMGDSIYAFASDRIYSAALADNLVDYTFWHQNPMVEEPVQDAVAYRNTLFILAHDSLYSRVGNSWQLVAPNRLDWIHLSDNQLLVYQRGNGLLRLMDDNTLSGLTGAYVAQDAVFSQGEYWLAEEGQGLVRLNTGGDNVFRSISPLNNYGYRLTAAHDHIYVASGGRWASQYGRPANLSIYDGTTWRGIPWSDINRASQGFDMRDAVSYAVDRNDPGHFFVATYGTGVAEFKDYQLVQHFTPSNSTLREAVSGVPQNYYTRTDGAMMDENGNLWILNATDIGSPVHVYTPEGQWHALNLISEGQAVHLITPGEIWVDRRSANRKWIMDQRYTPGVILLDDGGTPTSSADDRCMKRSTFVDQNGNQLTLDNVLCVTQDRSNRMWIGTSSGIIVLPASVDFFTSNECRRIIIPRNDGTGLGDYLLGDERINCMASDGGGRMWIGTETSGLYLIEDDTITVAHFTEKNSLLPADRIQSIAIIPTTGEVFVGTDKGIASYRSDASEAGNDFSGAYAFPNPVRPDYGGMISIAGLMENTIVNIVDAGGNLVCKTRSQGGIAVWDGKLADGRRATPGVYTALCNAEGKKHTVVKILVAR